MLLVTPQDFETQAGRNKIVMAIHALEKKVHELEQQVIKLGVEEEVLERDLKGPETY